MIRVSSSSLVGRTPELAQLDAAFLRACQGQPKLILVGGEAGVGKTRLITEFVDRATAGGAKALVGGCIDLSSGDLPYAPFVDALRGFVRADGPVALREAAGSGYEQLSRILPFDMDGDHAAPPARPDFRPHGSQPQLFDAALRFLGRLGQAAPVILVLEDLHWADCATLDLVAFLIRTITHERVLIVGTYRTSDLHPGHRLRTALANWTPQVGRVDLDRFGFEELRELIQNIHGTSPQADLVRRILDLSDGNAFLAEELLASGAGTGGRDVPPPIREVVLARVETLSETAQEVVRVASTAGRRATHRLLATVSELPDRRLLDALRECVAHQVLLIDPVEQTYVVRHALTREAVHAELMPGERQKLHAALATALTGDPSLGYPDTFRAAAERAYHWNEAGEAPRSLAAAVEAGRAAMSVFAFGEAQRQFERVLGLWPQVPEADTVAGVSYCDALLQAADACHWSGRVSRAVEYAHAALSCARADTEPERVVALKERLGRYLWEAGDSAGSMRAYEEANQLLASMERSPLHASLLTAQATGLVLGGHYATGLAKSRETHVNRPKDPAA